MYVRLNTCVNVHACVYMCVVCVCQCIYVKFTVAIHTHTHKHSTHGCKLSWPVRQLSARIQQREPCYGFIPLIPALLFSHLHHMLWCCRWKQGPTVKETYIYTHKQGAIWCTAYVGPVSVQVHIKRCVGASQKWNRLMQEINANWCKACVVVVTHMRIPTLN